MKKYTVLGINYPGHDTSAALMINGDIVAACEQERLDRQKHSRSFPLDAINECLRLANITLENIDEIAVNKDPKYLITEFYLRPALTSNDNLDFFFKELTKVKAFYYGDDQIRSLTGFSGKISFHRHHDCHLAAAYYPSGFNSALVTSFDGLGEIETSSVAIGSPGKITRICNGPRYPHSLGLFYASVTFYLGWLPNCDEGIVMGLAAFGDPDELVPGQSFTYYEKFEEIIKLNSDGDLNIPLEWVGYYKTRDKWVSDKFVETFGPLRVKDSQPTKHHMNIAAALQKRIEHVVLTSLKRYSKDTGLKKLCLSGGVGLNCSLNGKIYKSKIFDEIYVQPASGDAGTAIGACYLSHKIKFPEYIFKEDKSAYYGSRYSSKEIDSSLKKFNVNADFFEDPSEAIADYLSEGLIIAWFQDGAEFGPRALGNRSILAKPFPVEMKDFINNRVKFREAFRPFAPAVLAENCKEYFDLDQESPHMLIACDATNLGKDKIPATVHVDGSARVQTVSQSSNCKLYKLLEAFKSKTGVPVLLNTSFNIKGQPIVNTVDQAIETFLSTRIDVLCVHNYVITKK